MCVRAYMAVCCCLLACVWLVEIEAERATALLAQNMQL